MMHCLQLDTSKAFAYLDYWKSLSDHPLAASFVQELRYFWYLFADKTENVIPFAKLATSLRPFKEKLGAVGWMWWKRLQRCPAGTSDSDRVLFWDWALCTLEDYNWHLCGQQRLILPLMEDAAPITPPLDTVRTLFSKSCCCVANVVLS